MLRKGYIEQQIEALQRLLAGLLRHKEEDAAAALVELDEAGRRLAGLSTNTLAALPEPALLALFMTSDGRSFDAGKCLVAATLLAEQGDIRARADLAEAALVSRNRAILLLTHALAREERLRTHPDARAFVAGILEGLSAADVPLSAPSRLRLARLCEALGRFRSAEQALLGALQSAASPDAARAETNAFYERLLRRSDAELALGGLTRAGVEAALQRQLGVI
jgi:hypothetical protein